MLFSIVPFQAHTLACCLHSEEASRERVPQPSLAVAGVLLQRELSSSDHVFGSLHDGIRISIADFGAYTIPASTTSLVVGRAIAISVVVLLIIDTRGTEASLDRSWRTRTRGGPTFGVIW